MALNLITDRTQADVDALKSLLRKGAAGMTASERLGFSMALNRGAYNYTDYNRVGAAVAELAGMLNANGYAVSVTAKSDWTEDDNIAGADRAAYLADLEALKEVFYGTTALPDAWENITFEDANNVEKLLLEIEWNIYCMLASFIYSGEAFCGEF